MTCEWPVVGSERNGSQVMPAFEKCDVYSESVRSHCMVLIREGILEYVV